MDSKSIFASKTLWLNLLGPLFTLLAAHGLDLTPDQQLAAIGIVMSAANIIVRLFTKQPVHVVAPPAALLLPVSMIAFGLGLAGCGTGAPIQPLDPATLQTIFQNACAGVSIADGAFKAASPALVASGKLTAADVTKEQGIFAAVQGTCASPPADIAAAAVQLVGDAAAIYLLIAPPVS